MEYTIERYDRSHLGTLRELVSHHSLRDEFRWLAAPGGLEDHFTDPYTSPDLRRIARADAAPVGFGFALIPPSGASAWAVLRIGVLEPFRRRGLGSRLLGAAVVALEPAKATRGLGELDLIAWTPNPAAEGFAARHGFRPARTFWKMVRPRAAAGPPAPAWPAGIEVRTYDGSERALGEWNEAYNAAFAEHWHFVPAEVEHARAITRLAHFRPAGLVLAYRDRRCVGFCRNALRGREGEVALLGTVPGARGIGLGRALLRWSVAWLEAQGAAPIELGVDGENEGALALYRAEGFAIERTRTFWSREL